MSSEILEDIFDLQKINSLMKEASSIKEYFQYIKEWSFINGQYEEILEENKEKINYIYKKNDIDYVKSKKDIGSIQMLEKWLKTFGDEKEISSIKIVHSNLENQIEEDVLNDYGKRISYKFAEYEILIHYEEYIENLLFYQGTLEKRKSKYFFIMIKKNTIEIDTLFYTQLPELNVIMKEISKRIKNYEKWMKLPLLDMQSHTVKEIKCLTTAEVSAAIFHEAIGHLVEKDVYENVDKNRDSLYKKLSREQLNVIDVAKDTIIISDGILIGIMDDGLENRKGYYPRKRVFCITSKNIKETIALKNEYNRTDLKVTVNTVVSKMNLEYIMDMIYYCINMNVDEIVLLQFIPEGNGKENDQSITVDETLELTDKIAQEYKNIRDKINIVPRFTWPLSQKYAKVVLGKEFPKTFNMCGAGSNFFYINNKGEVFPCDRCKKQILEKNSQEKINLLNDEIWNIASLEGYADIFEKTESNRVYSMFTPCKECEYLQSECYPCLANVQEGEQTVNHVCKKMLEAIKNVSDK